ncbi:phage major capsid protein [Thauera butanivorans]|uniref:phage major capsid protein n=1 Tax=Thauera butanivorans TaxID=86174 RepID=UPI003AB4E7BF
MKNQHKFSPRTEAMIANAAAESGRFAMGVHGGGGRPHHARERTDDEFYASVDELARDTKEMFAAVSAYKDMVERRGAETNARMAALEQAFVASPSYDKGSYSVGGVGVGVLAMNDLRESPAFASLSEWNQCTARARLSSSIKSALTNIPSEGLSSDGSYMPSRPERAGIVGPVLRPLQLLEVLPSRPTEADAVEYIQLNATGEAAEQEVEGDAKALIDFDGELRKAEIATVAGWTAASRQVLSDHAALQANIDNVIQGKLLDRLENLLINGGASGSGKIVGLLDQGTVFLPTVGATPADIIGEAAAAMAERGYSPSVIAMHPRDWFAIQISRDDNDGAYLFGSPTAPIPPSLWNQQVVLSSAIDRGTALVLDTAHVTVLDRQQMSVMLSNSHADFFTRNLVAILGELRAGLEVRDTLAVYIVDLVSSGG